jgi:predicted dinucleotide-binding enzyme
MTSVIVVIGAGSIGQAIARRVAQASTSFWLICAKITSMWPRKSSATQGSR